MDETEEKIVTSVLVVVLAVGLVVGVMLPRLGGGTLSNDAIRSANDGEQHSASNLERVHDEKAGVVCWVYDGRRGAAVDCLPENETRLNEQGDSMTDKNHNKATEAQE